MVFSERSKKGLANLHTDGQIICNEVIKVTQVDFCIVETHRPIAVQQECFKRGRRLEGGEWVVFDKKKVITNIDGVSKLGKHNETPAMAFDICVYVKSKPGLTYDKMHLAYLAGVFLTTAKRLYAEGRVDHLLRWGGNWDGDGIIVYDHLLADMPHFELLKPKLT